MTVRWLLLVATLASAPAAARYDWQVRDANPLWKRECGACHLTYMPRWLSAETWRRIMRGLEQHFGANASLDERSREEITGYLVGHAGPEQDTAATLRVSDTAWFLRGHGRGAARLWVDGRAGNAADCTACHRGPVLGD